MDAVLYRERVLKHPELNLFWVGLFYLDPWVCASFGRIVECVLGAYWGTLLRVQAQGSNSKPFGTLFGAEVLNQRVFEVAILRLAGKILRLAGKILYVW